MYAVENKMVLDSWWNWWRKDEEEKDPKEINVDFDVNVSKLDDEEVTTLIDKLESLAYIPNPYLGLDGETTFRVNYDLDENCDAEGNEAPIVLIQIRGYCYEEYNDGYGNYHNQYEDLIDILDYYGVNWIEV